MNRVIDFVKKEIVLIISFVLAIISMFFVPPSERYIDYIDRRTLGLLFCLMTIMAGLNRLGLFKLLAEKLVHKVHTIRGVTVTLVLLCFFISMIITNDVTLITFVPFTIILLEISHQKSKLIYIVTLETISANLGSMTTPIGNPQNLYLFSNYNMNIDEFIIAIIPYSVLSLVLLVVLSIFVGNESITVEKELNRVKGSKNSFLPIMYGILFILALFSVFKILDYRVLLGVLLIAILSLDRITLIKVDYSLIFTFVFLFIFKTKSVSLISEGFNIAAMAVSCILVSILLIFISFPNSFNLSSCIFIILFNCFLCSINSTSETNIFLYLVIFFYFFDL